MKLILGSLALLLAITTGCGKPAAPAGPSPASLVGRWVRPDGGYVLQVERVAADGTAQAAYFNPQPIRVAAARARVDGGSLTLFVELRDVGYPGCTYQLTYDHAQDQLRGVYFQAAQQQRYEVFFTRLP